jgi:hypothetical protein
MRRWTRLSMRCKVSHVLSLQKRLPRVLTSFLPFLLGKHAGDFLLGAKPSLADVVVFGIVRSLEGYSVFSDVMINSRLQPWYARMTQLTGPPARVNPATPPSGGATP